MPKKPFDCGDAANLIWANDLFPKGCLVLRDPNQTAFPCTPSCEAWEGSVAGVAKEQWVYNTKFLNVKRHNEGCKSCGFAIKCLAGDLSDIHKHVWIFVCLKCERISVVTHGYGIP